MKHNEESERERDGEMTSKGRIEEGEREGEGRPGETESVHTQKSCGLGPERLTGPPADLEDLHLTSPPPPFSPPNSSFTFSSSEAASLLLDSRFPLSLYFTWAGHNGCFIKIRCTAGNDAWITVLIIRLHGTGEELSDPVIGWSLGWSLH